MRRAHVESIVCGAMFSVACGGSSRHDTGFSGGPDASVGFDASAFGMGASRGNDAGGGSGDGNGFGGSPVDAAVSGGGGGGEGGRADGGVCGLCPASDLCCSDPTSIGYGTCYSPLCAGCCQSGQSAFDGGSCIGGGSCGSNESCCRMPGSLDYGRCYSNSCIACCQGGGEGDAGTCGRCDTGLVCCAIPGAPDYGHCYPPGCAGCCQ